MPFACFKKTREYDPNNTLAYESMPDKKRFFVITVIFNPASFQTRYDLYHKFAKHMKETSAQLITIECIFPSLNQHDFQVTDYTNPHHIQVRSESVYWIKENLINIAVSRLPPHAKWVCWLDADINFHRSDWVNLTIKQLKKYSVVQVFKKAQFLGPALPKSYGPPPQNRVFRIDYSFGYSVINQKPIDQGRYDEWYPHPGYGWAMSVQAFNCINGLPDYDIVGSGDLHFAFSLLNRVANTVEQDLNPVFKQQILDHSQQTYDRLVDLSNQEGKGLIGFVPVTISHNWHGSRKDRQYVDRWKILIAHNFNFYEDIQRLPDGLLRLNPNKPNLQRDILQHFQMRKEDENKPSPKDDIKYKNNGKIKPKQKIRTVHRFPRGGSSSSSSSSDDFHQRQMQMAAAAAVMPPNWDEYNPPCPPYDDDCTYPPENDCGNGNDYVAGTYSDNYGGNVQCTSQY